MSSSERPKPKAGPIETHAPSRAEKDTDPKPSTSKTPEVRPCTSKAPIMEPSPALQQPATTGSKKKKPTRTERQARREAAVLKALYAPKQSRVTLISPAIMQLMNKNTQESPKVTPVTFPLLSSGTNSKADTPSSSFDQEFPNVSTVYLDAVKKRVTTVNVAAAQDGQAGVTPTVTEAKNQPSASSTAGKSKNKHAPSKAPIVINLQELLAAPSGSFNKKVAKRDKKKARSNLLQEKTKVRHVGNILDSSGLTFIHRGKMRNTPKQKRPTKLKKAIITSRTLRKVTIGKHFGLGIGHTQGETVPPKTSPDSDASPVEGIPEVPVVPVIKSELKEEEEETPTSSLSPEIPGPSIEPEENIFKKLLEEALLPPKEESRAPIVPVEQEIGIIPDALRSKVKERMHPKPKKFRKYCDMYTSKELHGHVIELMKELHRFQDRLYHSDPIKFKTHKRYISGLREVSAQLVRDKIQLIIIAPDIEPNDIKGGLDEKIDELLSTAKENGTPYLFSGNRFILGRPIMVKSQVAIIGILNRQGAEALVEKVMVETTKLREAYNRDFNSFLQEEMKLVRIDS